MYKLFKSEKGNVTILVSILMVSLMLLMALTIDVGIVYAEKAKLSKAIDAAILAGGVELPNKKEEAESIMQEYLLLNGVSLDQVQIFISEDGLSAEIIAVKEVDHYFAKIAGFDSSAINESSKIILGNASSVSSGLKPYAITKFDFQYGDIVVLKEGAGDAYHGNYGAISLGGTGVPALLDNSINGYDHEISIGDYVYTEPGNMASIYTPLKNYIDSTNEIFPNYSRNSDRVWTVPVFDTLEVDGRDAIPVVGFGQIFIEGIQKNGGDVEIVARFIEYVINGEIDNSVESTGLFAIKLVD